jgi:hypothetical protein
MVSAGLVLSVSIAVGGCATILSGTSDSIRFETRPSGAQVIIDGRMQGRTPLTTEVHRGLLGRDVTLRLAGYRTQTVSLGRHFNKTALGNVVCLWGVVLCGGVDIVTGAIMAYDSTRYHIELRRGRTSYSEPAGLRTQPEPELWNAPVDARGQPDPGGRDP